ncbi:MAG: DUF4097 family beta strand repeat protein [Verrucomicrobia bacterium]|nr:DUF4097 family beta strand repeat protein [Verrucomicrobiota bacterium]
MKRTLMSTMLRGLPAALLLGLASVNAAEFTRNLDQSFPVNPGGKLVIRADRGAIDVTTTAADKVEVRVWRTVRETSQQKADEIFAEHEVTFNQDGDIVTVTAKNRSDVSDEPAGGKPRRVSWLRRLIPLRARVHLGGKAVKNFEVRYQVTVPRKFNVDLKTFAGVVSVGDLAGEARSETSGGNLRFGRIEGAVWGKTYSGGIYLAGTSGSAELNTSGGNIDIGDVAGGVRAQTYSGSINLKKAGGKVDARTSGGNLNIEDAGDDLFAQTYSGSVRLGNVKGAVEAKTSGGDVVLDAGGGDVNAQTYSGKIIIGTARGRVTAKNSGGEISIGEAGGDIVAQTYSGSVRVKKCGGQTDAKTSGGDVIIGESAGEIIAQTYSGTIRIQKAQARVSAKNSGGNIEIHEAAGPIEANTFSGAITANLLARATGDCRFETAGGDIRLRLPRAAAFDLNARASAGKVVTEMPVTLTVHGEQKRGVMHGKINGGGAALVLQANSGSIYLNNL